MKKLLIITCIFLVTGIVTACKLNQRSETANERNLTSIVIDVHKVNLLEGVSEKEFEDFVLDKVAPLYSQVKGQDFYLMKGERGGHKGRYAFFLVVDNLENYNWIYPPSGDYPDEIDELLEGTDEIWEQLNKYIGDNWWKTSTAYCRIVPE